jgi:sugar phosphate isomerase/epimerase
MKPSWMTYGVLKDLSRHDLLQTLKDHGFEGVEFRTDVSHGHGVEAGIDADERKKVIADCEAFGIRIISIATGNRYHDTESGDLERHLGETRMRMDLAADLGVPRVRVFGNNFPKDVPREQTLSQVANALRELAEYGTQRGVKPALELHGEFDWQSCKSVAEQVDHENFGLIWNSVASDVVDGSVELFKLLHARGYDGYMSAEAERSADKGVGDLWMFVAYYSDLFRAYADLARA